MSRRITKLDLLVYVPGVPPTPYIAGYERVLQTWTASGSSDSQSREIYDVIGDWNGGEVLGRYRNGIIEAYTRIPPVEATPGAAAYTIDEGVAAWNAGGSSVTPLDGNGAFEFYTSANPGGIVCGLSSVCLTHQPGEVTHGIYIHGSVAEVYESGSVVHRFPSEVSDSTRFEVRRTGAIVTYLSGDDTFVSGKPIGAEKVYLDAALYLSGDYVDSPLMVDGSSGVSVITVQGTLPALQGRVGDCKGSVYGVLPALQGSVFNGPAGSTIRVTGMLPMLYGAVSGGAGSQLEISGVLPALCGVVKNYAYSFIDGRLPALRGEVSNVDPNFFRKADSALQLSDSYQGVMRVSGSISSSLRLVSTSHGVIRVNEYVYDALMLNDGVTSSQALSDSISSGLELGSGLSRHLVSDMSLGMMAARAPTQYAVNAQTGALTTYSGFEFNSFARTSGESYGSRRDGVYLLRPGDDDGQPRVVAVDFGVMDLGADSKRIIESAYLGIDTDGDILVCMAAGEKTYQYPAAKCGDLLRAVCGKGASSRMWNVSLEVEGATYLKFDMIELFVTDSGRGRAKR